MRQYETIDVPHFAGREVGPFLDRLVAALWEALRNTGVSWAGFYRWDGGADQMVLGPCRDRPACSPIGMHGVCGRAWREQRPVVVGDVRTLGDAYVACDPRDRSEVVVPAALTPAGWEGVLDLDSFEPGAFDASDAEGLRALLRRAGFTVPTTDPLVL